ncbi:MAG: SDR family oxidoreductase [Myxococcota bacterium]
MTDDRDEARVALVTGANRGLGRETVRRLARDGYRVLLGARDPARGRDAHASFDDDVRGRVEVVELDVTDRRAVADLGRWVRDRFGRLDVLVNNAGVMPDAGISFFDADPDVIRSCFETNTLSAVHTCQVFVPLMRERDAGRVVNVSSGMGQLHDMGGATTAYRVSKAALHAVTRIVHEETRGTYIKVNAVCPGWVNTDLGGPDAPRTVEEGADCIVWLATLRDDGPSGGLFRDCKQMAW